MSDGVETIDVADLDEAGVRLFEKALDHPVLLERNGTRVRLLRDDVYDPERAIRGMRAAGVISGIDPEEFKAHIYRAREAGSREPSDP